MGAGGAFDKDKKTNKTAVFGAVIGASIGFGKKWTMEDSLKLSATVAGLENEKRK